MQENWHILLVEDDAGLQEVLKEHLMKEGLEVTAFDTGTEAEDFVEQQGLPHLAVVDIRLPDIDGLKLAHRLHDVKGLPTIMITAFDAPETRLKSLQAADDYVMKPFEPAELVLRVNHILARIIDFSYAGTPPIEIDDRIQFDYAHSLLIVDGQELSLTPIEAKLLRALVLHRGHIMDSRALIGRVWQTNVVYEDTLRVHIHRLRRKIERNPRDPQYIVTVRGVGYTFGQ